jgi:hypothetical protein
MLTNTRDDQTSLLEIDYVQAALQSRVSHSQAGGRTAEALARGTRPTRTRAGVPEMYSIDPAAPTDQTVLTPITDLIGQLLGLSHSKIQQSGARPSRHLGAQLWNIPQSYLYKTGGSSI